jgi:dethiobiotin synthetase
MTTIFVAGTGTDVGKTWVAVNLIAALQTRGHIVHARKPAQSFDPAERGTTDAELLANATGEAAAIVCPEHRWYEVPMAPPMAAAVLGRPEFTLADLAAETTVPPSGITLVEGAGGPRSPLASDGDNVGFARAIRAERALLVADAGLGTINAVELSVAALSGFETVVVLNRFNDSDLHHRNRDWLGQAGHRVVTSIQELADQLATRLPASESDLNH